MEGERREEELGPHLRRDAQHGEALAVRLRLALLEVLGHEAVQEPAELRRVAGVAAGRRLALSASALFAASVIRTSDPIAAGAAGAATARSAVARPVSSAKRVNNKRKDRPLITSSRRALRARA